MAHPTPERIEYLQSRRTRLTFIQGLLFLIWQANFFALYDDASPARRAVSNVKISAYIVWACLLLVFLATGGNWWSSREERAILNDETTRAHRQQALSLGFFAAMAAAVGCYVVTLFEPVSGREAIHAILTIGIATALLTFGRLERRAQRAG